MASRASAAEKVRRDSLIVADRARGLGWPRIAERHDLSDRQCRNIWREHLREASACRVVDDPLAVVEEALLGIESVIEDAALLYEESGNPSVRAAALKTRLAALDERLVLQQALGYLPRDLGLLGVQVDVERTTRAIMGVLTDHEASIGLLRDIQRAVSPPTVSRDGSPPCIAVETGS